MSASLAGRKNVALPRPITFIECHTVLSKNGKCTLTKEFKAHMLEFVPGYPWMAAAKKELTKITYAPALPLDKGATYNIVKLIEVDCGKSVKVDTPFSAKLYRCGNPGCAGDADPQKKCPKYLRRRPCLFNQINYAKLNLEDVKNVWLCPSSSCWLLPGP